MRTMSKDLLSLQNTLIDGKLPVLDATLERFELLSARQTTTHSHLAEIIRSDIGYTLAMFRTINSNLPLTRDPVQTIEHAISMMGVPKVSSLGHELLKISSLPEKAQTELKNLYSQAFHASQYFLALAIQSHIPHPEENAKNIRLMNMAQVLLWSNQQDAIESHQRASNNESQDVPFSLLDDALRGLSMGIAKKWKLPTDLQQSLEPVSEDNQLAIAMNTATEIARQTAIDWHNETLMQLVDYWAEQTESPQHRILNTLHQLAAETGRQIDGRHLPVPAFQLFFPAPPKPVEEKQQSVDQDGHNTAQQVKSLPAEPKNSAPKKPQDIPAKKEAPAAPKKPANPLQDILTRQMKNMQKDAGVCRVMFAMLSPDRKKLTVRFVVGAEAKDTLKHFHADLTKKSIFSLLMEKPQGIHLTKENYKKYLQLIPSLEQKNLQVNNLFAMSMFVKERPIGLFVADNKKHVLTAEHYKNFKKFCNQAINDLVKDGPRKAS